MLELLVIVVVLWVDPHHIVGVQREVVVPRHRAVLQHDPEEAPLVEQQDMGWVELMVETLDMRQDMLALVVVSSLVVRTFVEEMRLVVRTFVEVEEMSSLVVRTFVEVEEM